MTMNTLTRTRDAAALRGMCGGDVHLPGDPGYDAARTAWNLAVDQRPAAVAFPRTPADVASLVRAAARAGLRVAPQGTGHGAGPLAANGLDDVVLLRMSRMADVRADPATRTVRVGGGATWQPTVEAAGEHGLAVLHGSSPRVGVAGYALGGGIGWYARSHGLAANSITAAEVVLADGSLVRVDASSRPDLFWALRGGGGSFGVVTALELSMYRIATAYAGALVWDVSQAERVLRRWAAWAPGAPDEVTTSFRVQRLPSQPDVPAGLRGRRVAVVNGAVLGTDVHGRQVLAQLRELRPEIDTFDRTAAPSLLRLHLDPEGRAPLVSDSTLLHSLPDAAVDAFLAQVGPGSGSLLGTAELRQLGGALGRAPQEAGVLSQLDGGFLALGEAAALTPGRALRGQAAAMRLTRALAPWASGTTCLNFAGAPADPRTAYGEQAWRRLTGIRSAVDPDGVFLANHVVPRLNERGGPPA